MAKDTEYKPAERSPLLIKCGFIKEDKRGNYSFNEKTSDWEPVSGYKLKSDDANEEFKEILKDVHDKTGFPPPIKAYTIAWEVYDLSLEEPYFWILDILKENFPIVEKLEDSFAAAENSAFFGVTQQRLGAQQDRVTQILATVGKMIKDLFQMVRELRIIKERMTYYNEAEAQLEKPVAERSRSAEITLKGMFVDLVQGGGKSAASIYGMARELEFITLPDLFFDAPPFRDYEEMDEHIKLLEKDFNKSVLKVLQRHLRQFLEWKKRTSAELKSRHRFMLQYLRQHFEIIKMYINWIKPYLRHISRMGMKESSLTSPNIVSAFEGSMLDIEILARKEKLVGDRKANSCILATFNYRTRPELKFVQEGYQRGPVHIGKLELNLRVYAWSDQEVDNYKKLKEREAMFLMSEVSTAVHEAMESLGAELDTYLAEAKGEGGKGGQEAEPEKKSFAEKFFGDFYTPKRIKSGSPKPGKKAKVTLEEMKNELKAMEGHAKFHCWNTYNNFKKSRGMIAW